MDPKERMVVVLKLEKEPYSLTGKVYRAYREDGSPLYLGEPKLENLKQRVLESYMHKKVEFQLV